MKTFATVGLATGLILAMTSKAPAMLPVIDYAEELALEDANQIALAVACLAAWRLREAEKRAAIASATAALLRPFEEYREALKGFQAQLDSRLDEVKAAQMNQGGGQ